MMILLTDLHTGIYQSCFRSEDCRIWTRLLTVMVQELELVWFVNFHDSDWHTYCACTVSILQFAVPYVIVSVMGRLCLMSM
jgi:hypothetical protein